MMSRAETPSFAPGDTPGGELPPWEVAKAFAFDVVIDHMRKGTGKSTRSLLNATKAQFIAGQVATAHDKHPCARAVQHVVARCQDPEWYRAGPCPPPAAPLPAYRGSRRVAMATGSASVI